MLTIVCYKWNKPGRGVDFRRRRVVYTAEHVNNLSAMVSRHLTIPHRFLCFTDDPTGIKCETQLIPAAHLLKYGGCWVRLWLFSKEACAIGEQVVSIDLDTVIVGSLAPLFAHSQSLAIWGNLYPKVCGPYCGSIWSLFTGSLPEVWEDFSANNLRRFKLQGNKYKHVDCNDWVGSDQCWIGVTVPDARVWTAEDGVLSYRLQARGELPSNARIVNFHGCEDPSLSSCQRESPWILDHWR